MSDNQTTPWFEWPAVPVRVGFYEWTDEAPGRDHFNSIMLYWDGRTFGYFVGDVFVEMAGDEGDRWRGLRAKA